MYLFFIYSNTILKCLYILTFNCFVFSNSQRMTCVFADVSTVFVRLSEIENVQPGLQRQLEKIQSRIDALPANQGAPDRLPNTPADRKIIGASTMPAVKTSGTRADRIGNGENVLPTVKPTGTVREDLDQSLLPDASVLTSTPDTKATSPPVCEAILTQTSGPVTETIATSVTKAISTAVTNIALSAQVTDATSAPFNQTISTGIAEAISTPITDTTSTGIAEDKPTSLTEAISAPQTQETKHNSTQHAVPLIFPDTGCRIDDTTKPQVQQEWDALFTEKTGGMDGSCTAKIK